jgi:hypothetical protein
MASMGHRESPETPSNRSEIDASSTAIVCPGDRTSSRLTGDGEVGASPAHAVTARRQKTAGNARITAIIAGLVPGRPRVPTERLLPQSASTNFFAGGCSVPENRSLLCVSASPPKPSRAGSQLAGPGRLSFSRSSVPNRTFVTKLPGRASRLPALLFPYIFPICSVVAPCQPGAALRDFGNERPIRDT